MERLIAPVSSAPSAFAALLMPLITAPAKVFAVCLNAALLPTMPATSSLPASIEILADEDLVFLNKPPTIEPRIAPPIAPIGPATALPIAPPTCPPILDDLTPSPFMMPLTAVPTSAPAPSSPDVVPKPFRISSKVPLMPANDLPICPIKSGKFLVRTSDSCLMPSPMLPPMVLAIICAPSLAVFRFSLRMRVCSAASNSRKRANSCIVCSSSFLSLSAISCIRCSSLLLNITFTSACILATVLANSSANFSPAVLPVLPALSVTAFSVLSSMMPAALSARRSFAAPTMFVPIVLPMEAKAERACAVAF